MRQDRSSAVVPANATVLLVALAGLTLLLHLLTSEAYGYFRDELYYIACSNHLAAGYVDHPPLSIAVLALVRWALGDSLLAIRFVPAVAGALLVLLTGLIARELGGGRFAQGLAALAVLVAPVYLAMHSFFSMNAFEPLLWGGAAYVLVRLAKDGNPKLWLLFGVLVGVGLENKHSMLFFGFSTVVALLLTPQRRWFATGWPWLAGLVALIIFLPNLVWQATHQWPTLEFLRHAQAYKNYPVSPVEFIGQQILTLQPVTLPIWLAGIVYCLFSPSDRRFRFLGWIYVVALVVLLAEKGKPYYLAPAYPMMFAAGAVALEHITERAGWNRVRAAFIGVLVVAGLVTMPMGLPVLPVDTFIWYSQALGLGAVAKKAPSEKNQAGALPQYFGDRLGWNEVVGAVARAFNRLSPQDRGKAAIFVQNYGEAAAVDFFGSKYHLPKALSGHNNYWLWGPGEYSGEVVVVLGASREELQALFETVEQVETVHCGYCMPYENDRPVYICRHLKRPLREIWPQLKHYV
jgi:4-amino-4-deoxy-L-arabinose transferase-like glycosyltransferase